MSPGVAYNYPHQNLARLSRRKETRFEIIGLDAHKRYSQVCVQKKNGQLLCEKRIPHQKGQIAEFLSRWTAGSEVAIETVGNWYWIVDEIEKANMKPKLVHAHKAKLMLGSIKKTDKLDARGLNLLQRAGTLYAGLPRPGGLPDIPVRYLVFKAVAAGFDTVSFAAM